MRNHTRKRAECDKSDSHGISESPLISLWREQEEFHRSCYISISSALRFGKGCRLSEKDLTNLLGLIDGQTKSSMFINLSDLKLKCSYSERQLRSLVERLKKLGEIFDPHVGTEKEGTVIARI